jgi:hypothetical protein
MLKHGRRVMFYTLYQVVVPGAWMLYVQSQFHFMPIVMQIDWHERDYRIENSKAGWEIDCLSYMFHVQIDYCTI